MFEHSGERSHTRDVKEERLLLWDLGQWAGALDRMKKNCFRVLPSVFAGPAICTPLRVEVAAEFIFQERMCSRLCVCVWLLFCVLVLVPAVQETVSRCVIANPRPLPTQCR